MEIQEVTVFVRPNGTVDFEVRGVKGKACLDVTKEIEKVLGGEVLKRAHTSEMEEGSQGVTESVSIQPGW